MQSRDDGERHGGVEREFARDRDPVPIRLDLVQQNRCDRNNLRERVCLAEDAGTKFPPPYCCIKKRRHHKDPEISAEDHYRHGDRHKSLVQKHKKERTQQQLIGHRIEILAEHGALL